MKGNKSADKKEKPPVIAKREMVCEECGTTFMGDHIEHSSQKDDWDWEHDEYGEQEYPHVHEQPTVECHICPKCREIVNASKK